MGPLCVLEERHGVDLGAGYKNSQACSMFVDYIAQSIVIVLILLSETVLDCVLSIFMDVRSKSRVTGHCVRTNTKGYHKLTK